MNNFIFKKLFNVLVSTIFILPIDASFGDQDHFPPVPGSPQPAVGGHAAPAPAPLTDAQKESLSQLLARATEEIKRIHKHFDKTEILPEGHPDNEKTKIIVHDIKKRFDKLLPVFVQNSQRKGVHYTPENTGANGTHLEDIKGNPSAHFTSKGPADFLSSVDVDDFYVVSTHFGNTYFIPKWMTEPNKGFGLYQQGTQTLDRGVVYSDYNVRRMLVGENPLSHSGVLEIHHAYQNQETVCYLCHSEHKGKFKEYHKSERETLINRAIAGSEAYYINKLTALIAIAKAAAHILYNEDSVSSETSNFMMFIKEYRGNLTLIPNGTERVLEKSTKLREYFEHMARKAPAHDLTSDSDHSDDDTEVLAFPDFDLPSKRDSLSSERTSLASAFGDFDDSNSRDSVASSSSSLVQQTRRVSISSAVTDTLSSDEEVPSVVRKKIVAKRGSDGKLQRSTSSVTQEVQKISIAKSSDEASQKSTQPEKRDRNAREKADSEDPLIGKENTAPNSPVKKKPVGRSSERVRTILGTHNV
ncbi:MAG: hypothetical protein NTW22_06090 [Proteobacteria bacterium]|nr:hypothetical protein [Pseudomonadota bacterium]